MRIIEKLLLMENWVVYKYLTNGLDLPPIGDHSSSIKGLFVDIASPEYAVIRKRMEHFSFPQREVIHMRRALYTEEELSGFEFFSMVPEAILYRFQGGSDLCSKFIYVWQHKQRGTKGIKRCPKCEDIIEVDDSIVLDSADFKRTDVAAPFFHQPMLFSDRLAKIIKDSGFTGISFGNSSVRVRGELKMKGQLAIISSYMPERLEDDKAAQPLCLCGRVRIPDYYTFKPLVFSKEGIDQAKDFNLTREPSAGRIAIVRRRVRNILNNEGISGFAFIPVTIKQD